MLCGTLRNLNSRPTTVVRSPLPERRNHLLSRPEEAEEEEERPHRGGKFANGQGSLVSSLGHLWKQGQQYVLLRFLAEKARLLQIAVRQDCF